MPKKLSKSSKATSDFHFIVIISVFAALAIFAASHLSRVRQEAIQAAQRVALPVAQLDIQKPTDVATSPKPKATKAPSRPTPQPTTRPWHK